MSPIGSQPEFEEALDEMECEMNTGDILKIKAAAFVIRAGHTDEMAQAFVEELCSRGILGVSAEYAPVLTDLVERANRRTAREKLIRAFERHASSRVAEEVADEILGAHRRELAAVVRQAIDDDLADRPKWVSGMRDAAKLIEAVE